MDKTNQKSDNSHVVASAVGTGVVVTDALLLNQKANSFQSSIDDIEAKLLQINEVVEIQETINAKGIGLPFHTFPRSSYWYKYTLTRQPNWVLVFSLEVLPRWINVIRTHRFRQDGSLYAQAVNLFKAGVTNHDAKEDHTWSHYVYEVDGGKLVKMSSETEVQAEIMDNAHRIPRPEFSYPDFPNASRPRDTLMSHLDPAYTKYIILMCLLRETQSENFWSMIESDDVFDIKSLLLETITPNTKHQSMLTGTYHFYINPITRDYGYKWE